MLIQKNLLKKATEAIVAAVSQLKVGQPFDPETKVGPLISRGQLETVTGFVNRAVAKGAKILTGGKVPAGFDKGYFYEPTVLTNVEQKSEIVQQEVFGPVITIQTFTTEEEAITIGNDCDFGLAASVFTKDIARAIRVANRLEFGCVWINDHSPIGSEAPHGGFKQSGFGKDLSIEAVHDYQVTKHVMVSLA
ncbi:MAG: aldehyde dehydrogenase family protein [Desulfuromonadales bacterium]|nr:aldehyde dehydrogenase family protein [Desulfuromonadales bacterium]